MPVSFHPRVANPRAGMVRSRLSDLLQPEVGGEIAIADGLALVDPTLRHPSRF